MNNISMSKGQERGNPLCVTRKKNEWLGKEGEFRKVYRTAYDYGRITCFLFISMNVYF